MTRMGALAALALVACGGDRPVGEPPAAVLDVPSFCDLHRSVTLDGSRSSDPDGDIVLYRFTVADGSGSRVLTGPLAVHVCQIEGLIEVALRVEDARGHASTARAVVSVRPP